MLHNIFSQKTEVLAPKKEETSVTSDGGNTFLEAPHWNKNFKPWRDRLDFLSGENQQLHTGTMRILPAKGERKRYGDV